jgi:putative nucleotidyltransferase with HDIG domain
MTPAPPSQATIIQPEVAAALTALESGPSKAWLVGGAVRDRRLGRRTVDYDVVVDGDVRKTARALARAVNAHAFELSEQFGAWRLVPRPRDGGAGPGEAPASPRGPGPPGAGGGLGGEGSRGARGGLGGAGTPGSRARPAAWQLDVLPLLHGSIEADLALRDLTINALAQPLGGGDIVDPFGGVHDLDAERLRMVSPETFTRDPLRVLRLARLACELGFAVETQTAARAREAAPGLERVAPERVFEELKRILCADGAVRGLQLMDELQITPVVLPELSEQRGIEQSRFHHLDVYAHTLAVVGETIDLEREPQQHLGQCWQSVDAFMAAPLANGLTRWQALRFGALLHDIAKPQTRAVSMEGRVTFIGHDAAGAEEAARILGRLRTSERLRGHVAGLTRNHLRLGFLVHEVPLSRRTIYRYLQDCGQVAVDVTVLSVADRLATRGDRSDRAIATHLQLVDRMLCEALRWLREPPRPPVRGDDLAAALGVAPGPALGEILAELQEAAFAGEISSRDDAIRLGRALLDQGSGARECR